MPELPPVDGIRLGTTSAGIKTAGRPDLVLMELTPGTRTAAVFTRNAFCAARCWWPGSTWQQLYPDTC